MSYTELETLASGKKEAVMTAIKNEGNESWTY